MNILLRLNLIIALLLGLALTGCEKSPEPKFRLNEVYLLKTERAELAEFDRDEVLNLFKTNLSQILKITPEQVQETSKFIGLNADKITKTKLVVSLNLEFEDSFQMRDDELTRFTTVGEAVDHVFEKTKKYPPKFPKRYRDEIGNILTALFGTPNEPRFPFPFGEEDPGHEVLSLDNLEMAAGPVRSGRHGEPAGLYREHCAHCHGITGDGAGPTAAFLNPYPRDFRLGKFKFKSTPLRQVPTNDDLTRILKNGIPGTAMPSFRTMPETEVAALIDYVKYLTIRGQFERRLIEELSSKDGEPLLDFEMLDTEGMSEEEAAESVENFQAQLFTLVGEYLVEENIARWLEPDDSITEVLPAPEAFALEHSDHAEFISDGKALFHGKANCVQCHGNTGVGDGQTNSFDDWTDEWVKRAPGVSIDDESTWQPFLAAGALKPRTVRPRNLRMPVFRGGNRPDDLYRRIANGIEGTPMPSSPTLSPEEIWALVAYVKSMPFENPSPDKPTNENVVH